MMTKEEHKSLVRDMSIKTEEQINNMFNTGQFNDIMRGYIAMTMHNLDYKDEQIDEVMDELRYMLDMHTAGEARKAVQSISKRSETP